MQRFVRGNAENQEIDMLIDISSFARELSSKLSTNLHALRELLVDGALARFSIEELKRLVEDIEANADRPKPNRYN